MRNLGFSPLLLAVVCFIGGLQSGATLQLNLTASCANTQLYFCTLANLSVTFDDPLVLVVNASAPQLTDLVLQHVGPRLGNMPRDLFALAPNLSSLLLHNCGLNRLFADDFAGARQLRSFVMHQNRLSGLPERVFSGAFLLEELHLGHNAIHQLHRNAFAGLSLLSYLDLQQNSIRVLPERVFADLSHLEHIDLSSNEIEKIDADTFATNVKLQTVLLSSNKFVVFEPASLAALPHLHLLDVSANNDSVIELQLQSIDTLMAQNCGALERISIAGSAIKVHAGNCALTNLSISDKLAVRELDLHGNRFETLDAFAGMLNLHRLDVSKNRILSLAMTQSSVYLALPSLVHLIVASNQLLNVSAGNFLLLQKLTHLDVSFNHLWQLDARLFEPLPNLEKLYIEGNRLHTFDYAEFLRAHAKLKEFGIFANEWDFHFMRKMGTYLKDRSVDLPVRFAQSSALDLHEETTAAHHHYAATTTPDASLDVAPQQQLVGEVGGIHPYWTTRDVLALVTLLFVLLILLLLLYQILQEEQCLASCWRRLAAAQVGAGVTAAAQRRPRRLNEQDSEV